MASPRPLVRNQNLTANLSQPTIPVNGSNRTGATYLPKPAAPAPVSTSSAGPAYAFQPPAPKPAAPAAPVLQDPGNNLTNQGYGEQALTATQNRLLEDPAAAFSRNAANRTLNPGQGEASLNDQLGTLDGPGEGAQYWNQQQGQFQDPYAGEQFARDAAQAMAPTGAAGAFNTSVQDQAEDLSGYSGAGNTQTQYDASQQALAGGTQGQQGLGQIAGQYDSQGQYTDTNRAGAQYTQTQGAFGDMPIAEFDPFYDRARQLATQDYNRQSAGRGVYGSSEALSGVGNVITDIEAQRANRSFDAEMQRTQEQRARQQLLGEQARQGDLSSLGAFDANLAGASTYANINNMQATQELATNQQLANQANAADTQATSAQNTQISGINALSSAANNADVAETNRFDSRTNAMEDADRTQLDRSKAGADMAFRADDSERADFTAETNAANNSARLQLDRNAQGAEIADRAAGRDLNRLDSFNRNAQGAEGQRLDRQKSYIEATENYTAQVQKTVSDAYTKLQSGDYQSFEDWYNAELGAAMNSQNMSRAEEEQFRQDMRGLFESSKDLADEFEDDDD